MYYKWCTLIGMWMNKVQSISGNSLYFSPRLNSGHSHTFIQFAAYFIIHRIDIMLSMSASSLKVLSPALKVCSTRNKKDVDNFGTSSFCIRYQTMWKTKCWNAFYQHIGKDYAQLEKGPKFVLEVAHFLRNISLLLPYIWVTPSLSVCIVWADYEQRKKKQ